MLHEEQRPKLDQKLLVVDGRRSAAKCDSLRSEECDSSSLARSGSMVDVSAMGTQPQPTNLISRRDPFSFISLEQS